MTRPSELQIDETRAVELESSSIDPANETLPGLLLKSEVLKTAQQLFGVAKEIGKNNHQRAAANFLRQIVQDGNQAGVTARFGFLQRLEDVLQMSRIAAGRNVEHSFLARADQAGSVALMNDQIGKRRNQPFGKIDFRSCFPAKLIEALQSRTR